MARTRREIEDIISRSVIAQPADRAVGDMRKRIIKTKWISHINRGIFPPRSRAEAVQRLKDAHRQRT